MTSNFGSIRAANAYVAVNLRSQGIQGQLNQALASMRNQINRAFPKSYGNAIRANFNFAQQGFASRMGSSALLGLDHGAAIRASKFGGGGSAISAGSITGGILGADAVRGASLSLLKVIRLSRDYEETLNKFRMTFREFAGETERWADRTATSVQRSKTAFLEFSSQFQQFFVGFGFARRQAAEMSRTLTKLSVDIGSFYNVPDQEAARRLFQGLAGSTEALDIFGINAREARVKQQLGKTGVQFDKATAEQKVLARYNIILEATRDSQGDAFRTANSFANSLRGVSSAATELGINLGLVLTRSDDLAKETKRQSGILAPYVVQIRDITFGMARWVSENEDVVRSSFKTLGAIGALGAGLTALQVGYSTLSFVMSPAPFLALISPITTIIDRLTRLASVAVGTGSALGGAFRGIRLGGLGGYSGSGFRYSPSGYGPGRFADAMRRNFGASGAPFIAPSSSSPYSQSVQRAAQPRLLLGYDDSAQRAEAYRQAYHAARRIFRLEGPNQPQPDPRVTAIRAETRLRNIIRTADIMGVTPTIPGRDPGYDRTGSQLLLGYDPVQSLLDPERNQSARRRRRRAARRAENDRKLPVTREFAKFIRQYAEATASLFAESIPLAGPGQLLLESPDAQSRRSPGGALTVALPPHLRRTVREAASAFATGGRGTVNAGGRGQGLLGVTPNPANVVEGQVLSRTITDVAKVGLLSKLWTSVSNGASKAAASIGLVATSLISFKQSALAANAIKAGSESILNLVGLASTIGFDPRSRDGRAAAREEYRKRREQDKVDAKRIAARRRLGRMRFRSALNDPVGVIGSVGSSVVSAASSIAFGAVNTGVNVLSGSLSGLASIASLAANGLLALGVAVLALPFLGMAYRAVYLKTQMLDVKGTFLSLKDTVVSFTSVAAKFGTEFIARLQDVGQATGEFIKLGDMEGAITEVTGFMEESFLQAASVITQSFHGIFTSMKDSLIKVFDVMRAQLAPFKDLFDIQLGRDIVAKEYTVQTLEKKLKEGTEIGMDGGNHPINVARTQLELDAAKKDLQKAKDAAVFFGAGAVPTQGADLATQAEAGFVAAEEKLGQAKKDAAARRAENRARLKNQQVARGGPLTGGAFDDAGEAYNTVPVPVTEGTGADAGKIGPIPDDERKAFSWWKVRQNLVNNLGLGTPAIASMLGTAIGNEQNRPSFSNRSFTVTGDPRSSSGTTTRAATPTFRNSLDFSSLGGLITTPQQVAEARWAPYKATRDAHYASMRFGNKGLTSVLSAAVSPAYRAAAGSLNRFDYQSRPNGVKAAIAGPTDVDVANRTTASSIGRALLPGFKNLGKFIGGGGALGALQDAGAFEVLPGTIAKLGETVGRWQEMSGKQNQLTSELVSFGSFSGRAALYGVSASSDPSFQVQSRMLDELIRLREVAQAKKGVAI